MKKGEISFAFKYILVLVAGSIILLFFVRFAFMHAKTSENIGSVKGVTSLNDNLDAFAISPNADTTINLGYDADFKFDCGNIVAGNSQPIRSNKIIFSPKELKGKQIDAWTLAWRFPFKVGNFYYLNNDKNKIYVGGNNYNILNPVSTDRIPERFDIGASSGAKVVNFDITCGTNSDVCIKKDGLANCGEGSDYDCYGVVEFKRAAGGIDSYPFLGKPMLYGAIFSSDAESYKCSLKSALERLQFMLELYYQKSSDPYCKVYINTFKGDVNIAKTSGTISTFNDFIDNMNGVLNSCGDIF